VAQPYIQTSFNSGEWAPHLWARTDLEKYRNGAALLRNFFVDYRGGASTRGGTKYILRAYKDSTAVRLIPFQAAISVGFTLEFGEQYIRFHRNGAPVLEAGLTITGITQANPCVVSVANTYTTGSVDWVYITGVVGMTQLNGKYYKVSARTAGTVTLADLFGNAVDSSAYGAWSSGGTTQRVYTIASPYAAADLALLKFVQNIDVLILTHPDYVPYSLTFTTATSWALAVITFGSTATAPNNVVATTTLAGGSVHYSYVVTSIDGNGQESAISTGAALDNKQDLRTVAGTNTISWDPVAGAASYNVYKSDVSYAAVVPTGSSYGYIGNTEATSFPDSNTTADFSQPPPTANNPFATGSKVTAVTITTPGSYTTAPTCTFAAPPSGTTATGTPVLEDISATVSAGGANYVVGDTITLTNGVILTVATLTGTAVATATITDAGSATTLPANPVAQVSSSGAGTGATFTLGWGVYDITVTNAGTGYLAAPAITFSAGAAAGTATIGPASVGNPSVPTFFQQRLGLAAPDAAPQTIYFSRPGNYYNYDISTPAQDNDAITSSIVSGQLTNIKAMVPQPGGLIVFTDGVSYLINGGSLGSAITPASITANAQSFIGANDMPPIVVNFDILTVPAKGSSVRDSTYNFYANVFTGADISILSSHLFFGYELTEWAWAEEPYKLVWAVRNDGKLLSLTFIKEQEFIAWAHHDTEDGAATFKSVATIVEAASIGYQNFVYTVVGRTIGATPVQYIEYFPERAVSGNVEDYTTVDCSISYNGSPATTFQGAEFLAGKTCTGLADGIIIPAFTMAANGSFTLATAASKVTVGLAFTPQLQTLYIDIQGQQNTVQQKMKKINGLGLRVAETLGLKAGTDSSNLAIIKDLVRGNVGGMTNSVVTDLVTGDVFMFTDPKWQTQGQVFIEQPYPYPASILGFIPEVAVGDTAK
jgi:hypothetical protein